MTRKIRAHLAVGDTPSSGPVPKHLAKQEFANRLYNLILAKGWNQSEAARQCDLPRDAISVYVRGKSFPTPTSLEKLSRGLGVKKEDLLPNYVEDAISEDMPAFELRVSVNAPNAAWLRVNRLVSLSTAVAIAALLEKDDVVNRGGSGAEVALQPLKSETASAER